MLPPPRRTAPPLRIVAPAVALLFAAPSPGVAQHRAALAPRDLAARADTADGARGPWALAHAPRSAFAAPRAPTRAEQRRAEQRRAATRHVGRQAQRPALIGTALVGAAVSLGQSAAMGACYATRPWSVPDADLSLHMWDGYCAPRWAHHMLRASLSLAVAGGVAFVLPDSGRISPDVIAGATTVATGVVPHLVGYATNAYPFRAGDFLADAWISAAPLVVVQYRHGWRRGALATAAYAAGYLLLAPYASP